VETYSVAKSIIKEGDPVLYYLDGGSKRGFVREELQIVPSDTL
jgi:hypothetical protein